MRVKPEVTYKKKIFPPPALNFQKQIWDILPFVESSFRLYGHEAILSSGSEKVYWDEVEKYFRFIHGLSSLHYQGLAVDFSCRNIDVETSLKIQREIQQRSDMIGEYYQVLYETKQSHIHIEWDEP